ncbi:aminomethyl-transferring glycine dehydrogenase [Gynuella sunshinyii]|uniref:Glycine dehydrogenase (decarboxylating) n=1 Tax=Gynuella sunshinyii YC6258 TaxID=1445510 RepID=A0A0C5W1J0_9GAMM|nr:aminomethyl-transferring glycine dehydrogenase [Gynuella sunshinyii]AJQ96544.1 glycine cleavage system protein P (pyridoxal-binding), C-terminal domain [Gynuella sunshinyii YC6258]
MTTGSKTLLQLQNHDEFLYRHIGSKEADIQAMLTTSGAESLEDLVQQIVPDSIRLKEELALAEGVPESVALNELHAMARQNIICKNYIGMGYHDTKVPNVILRNVLENPGWYTAYTPYQPEIAQGRLEALLNFQQMIIDLTGMEMANASLLDEATAAAEAMAMAKRSVRKNKSQLFFVDENVLPQTLDVVKTRAEFFGFDVVSAPLAELHQHDVFGALFQYPGLNGEVPDLGPFIQQLHDRDAIAIVAADLLSLTLLKSPGEMGADIVLGNAQRFGVPMGFGGPHAAFFATLDKYKRSIPGRIIGVSIDSRGNRALRMALQTREQHIRREKANSNICTAQVLLANMAVFYGIYHGPDGIKDIAARIHRLTTLLANKLRTSGLTVLNQSSFDTLTVQMDATFEAAVERAKAAQINFRVNPDNQQIGISLHEKTTAEDVKEIVTVLTNDQNDWDIYQSDQSVTANLIPESMIRTSLFMTHPVFNSHHSETEMMRYLRLLEGKDLALNQAMISLGSCTMKLNAAAEMMPVSWPEFADIHPFAPAEQTRGYLAMITSLEDMLKAITGFDAVSIQPNSGAQGEYTGLLAIQKYHQSRGDFHRNICLIPSSAHGTNPASAQMAGLKVVVVKCDENGNVDRADLDQKVDQLKDQISCLMMTYPSTHGVYEDGVKEICELIHSVGAQVYMDGANLNAQVGLTRPADIGADVSHMNLHKTFAIPHGGGGPGMGPIGVRTHLAPFLPGHSVNPVHNVGIHGGAVSAAPYGSASILPISWMYIRMLGKQGLKVSTQMALLNANYLKDRLKEHYPILYTGRNDRVAHECIVDLRPLKNETGITEVDIAKRLMDYGFHAPTMSFPVAGTFMIEPTESESKKEIDRFADAMIAIKKEINQVKNGVWTLTDNPLVNAPHSQADLMDQNWSHSYSREQAAFPSTHSKVFKFWPSVNRIDDVYGDRNLICTCPPVSDYEEA